MSGETIQASPDDPAAEVLVEKAIDGDTRRVRDTFNDFVGNEGLTGAILKQCEKQESPAL